MILKEEPTMTWNFGRQVFRDKDNLFHNEEGPAIIWPTGERHYYIHGKSLSEEEFRKRKNNT